MRIIIEPTMENATDNRVEIENPSDDLRIDEVIEMFGALLVGFTFHPELVRDRLQITNWGYED